MIADAESRVKVLDFGLAKLTEVTSPHPEQATQTIRADDTEEGQILGTAAYMSPEQVEGKKVDARSDIFAFGLVLYEMVTGRRPFERDSRMAILSAILKEQQKPAGELVTGIPAELDKIINRCLRKDPDRRYQTMRDVRNALEELKEDSESGRLAAASVPRPHASHRGSWPLWGAIAGIVLALTGALIWLFSRTPPRPAPLTLRQLTADSGVSLDPAISPDGKFVAYASDRATEKDLDIWLHPLGEGGQPIRLTRNPAGDSSPTFSPDGNLIAFRSTRDPVGIYIIPALGGEERLLARGGFAPRFSPDGKYVAYGTGLSLTIASSVFVVPVHGGPARRIAEDVPWANYPTYSPDGKAILFLGASAIGAEDAEYYLVPVSGGPSVRLDLAKRMRDHDIRIATVAWNWLDGKFIASDGRKLWEIGLSSSGRIEGDFAPLTNSTSRESSPSATRLPDRRLIAFAAGTRSEHLWSLPIDNATGQTRDDLTPLWREPGSQANPTASPSRKQIAYVQSDPGGAKVRIGNLTTGQQRTLLSTAVLPRISPDGLRVAYSASNPTSPETGLFVMPVDGGDPTKVGDMRPGGNKSVYGWTPDGKVLFFDGTPHRFATLDPETKVISDLIAHPTRRIHAVQFSPDAKWIVFATPFGNRFPLYIARVRDGRAAPESEWIPLPKDGAEPFWSLDGNAIYAVSDLDGFNCLYRQAVDKAAKTPIGDPTAVYHFHTARRPKSLGGVLPMAIVPGKIILTLPERVSNIWIAEQKQ